MKDIEMAISVLGTGMTARTARGTYRGLGVVSPVREIKNSDSGENVIPEGICSPEDVLIYADRNFIGRLSRGDKVTSSGNEYYILRAYDRVCRYGDHVICVARRGGDVK